MVKRTYYTLKDKMLDKENMHKAAHAVFANGGSAGIDGQDVEDFKDNYKLNMRELHRQLWNETYEPSPVLRVMIPKDSGGERPLGIPTVKDRIAQETVRRILSPIFEKVFCDCSYGFRPNRSALEAIDKVEEYREQGYTHVVDADIKGYFDNIDQDLLLDFVTERVNDGFVLRAIKSWLTAGVMTEDELEDTPKGTPQGGVISPLLANVYLHQFDREMTDRGYKMVRYADDFVVLAKLKKKAKRAMEVTEEIISEKLNLTLHPEKTELTNFGRGFEFLGYEFIAWRYKRPRSKALDKFKDKIREITRRQQSHSLKLVIDILNPVIRGWANYFGHGNVKGLFRDLNEWIRMRLRSYKEGKKALYHQNRRIPTAELKQLGLEALTTGS